MAMLTFDGNQFNSTTTGEITSKLIPVNFPGCVVMLNINKWIISKQHDTYQFIWFCWISMTTALVFLRAEVLFAVKEVY